MKSEDVRQRIASLSPERRALLEQRLMAQGTASRNQRLIERRAFTGPIPLSFAQERLWFLEQLQPGQPIYHIPFARRLRGPLDHAALEQSLQEIVRRHDALRTTFDSIDGQPAQVIHQEMSIALELIDLTSQTDHDREALLDQLIAEQVRQPFDLTKGPLLRANLIRLGSSDHLLLLTMHHIISDGWSMHVLWRELGNLYTAIAGNQPLELPDLQRQYADYAGWQRGALFGEDQRANLTYWTQHLSGASPLIELPTDYPRPVARTLAGAHHPVSLSTSLTAGLSALSQRESATVFMVLLAAFQTLLYRYSGQSDLVVGTPIAGRTRPELEDLIGFFVNTLPLRTDLSGNPSFRQLLARVREVALDAYAHQELPFEQLVEALRPPRDLSYNPVVQVVFNFHNRRINSLVLLGLEICPVIINTGTAKFDLTLSLREIDGELAGWLEYSTDLFQALTIARMAQHFTMLLEAILTDPDQPIDTLPLLTATERQQLLVDWNATAAPLPEQTVTELFAAQVERTPDAMALVAGEQQLTYRQLNQRANQLAHHLQDLGVAPEVCVGLCLERSPELLIGILAILKAGGVYVPLDPGYPAQRLAFMLDEINAPVLLTRQHLTDLLPPGNHQLVCLDTDWPAIAQHPTSAPPCLATPDNLAYILYTSGSTGTPKGVQVSHQAVVRLTINTNYLTLGPADVVAQASNPAFDAMTFELWGAWLTGACLVVVPQDVLLTPPSLAEWLQRQQITTLFLTTALFNQVARDCPGAFAGLKHLLFGGEACDPQAVATVLNQGPSTRLLHVYGPTETTTFATSYAIPVSDAGAATIPIGRPIANTTAYVLDPHMQPVPIGVMGELFIGGVGVARGYLNRPELTSERFLPNPFSSDPSARLYKTGDLVRYRADGNLEFVGRIDHQVKLRGFRIELGEIESVLSQHPAVRGAAVLLREDRADERRLVAYIIQGNGDVLYPDELRRFLAERLPEFMLPAAFVPLAALPLTSNGKLDRHALPAPDRSGMVDDLESVLPRNACEQQLVQIWEGLLGVSPIGVRDNFFDLGGHSLMAVRLFAEIRRVFDIDLPLSVLFPEATIERLANAIQDSDRARPASSLVPIQPHGTRPPFFCVHSIDGDVLRFATLARYLGNDQPFYGLRARGLEGSTSPLGDIKEIAAAYLDEIRYIQPVGPYFLGGYSGGGTIAYEMARQLQGSGAEVALLAVIDHTPFGLRRMKPWSEALAPGNCLRFLTGNAAYCLMMLRGNRATRRVWLQSLAHTAGDWVRLSNRRQKSEESYTEGLPWRVKWLVTHLPDGHRRVANEHFQALNSYVPERSPGRITLLKTPRPRPALRLKEPEQRWSEVATGGIEIKLLTGRHEEIFDEPHVQVLGRHLCASLEQAQTSQP